MTKFNKSILSIAALACLVLASTSAMAAMTFPTTGYVTITTDGPDVGIDPDRDITTIGYQQDGVNAYFKISVVNGTNWGVSFSNERFFVYIDCDSDGNSDYLLYTDNPVKTKLMHWDDAQAKWVDTYSNTATSLDPNATPDEYVFLGVSLAELGLTDGMAIGTSAATANFKPTAQNPADETGIDDVTQPGAVGYGLLDSAPPTVTVSQTETATALVYDTTVTQVTFKWFDPANQLVRTTALVPVVAGQAVDAYNSFTSADPGVWTVTADYLNASAVILDSDTVNFLVVFDCTDADGDGAGIGTDCAVTDCDDADPNVWSACGTCLDADADGWYDGCDAYATVSGPDCDDADPNSFATCGTCLDGDADGWFAGCDAYSTVNGPDCDDGAGAVYPGAPELCDGQDNQCSGDVGFGQVDEGCGPVDTDGDGLADDDETSLYFTDPLDPDTDADGLGDYLEAVTRLCLDPLADDTDGDGILDGVEDSNHNGVLDPGETDPCGNDTDQDGLTDGVEIDLAGTDPADWDSDGDALPDGFEYDHRGDASPLDALDPADAGEDFDGDGNPNVHEYYNRTDLWVPDPDTHLGSPDYACAYWGEASGDCVVTSYDRTTLVAELLGVSHDFANIIPHSRNNLDLNGNGSIESSDRTIMQAILLATDPGMIGSRPIELEVVEAPPTVTVGDTVRVTVRARNFFGNYTSGLAVKFTLAPFATGSATILGGDGDREGVRYDYTGSGPDDYASIVLRADSPGVLNLMAFIPTCGTPGVGRYLDAVVTTAGGAPVVITVSP